jgi:4-amino-4-deoxy-L-arabinose transferase-like glycosyltransferase
LSALAVLTKGPVGIVLPVLIIGVFLLYVGKLRQVIAEMQLLRGSLLFLVITLPWYILVIRANGEDYINSFFGYHNLERFTQVVNNHWAPIWFYVAVVPLAFLPWSVYLPISILRLRFWQPQRWRQQPRSAHLGLFAFFWFAGVFGFFTIAVTKLPSYMIPLLPAAAILVGLFWSDQMVRQSASGKRPLGYGVWLSHLFNIGLAVVLAFAVFYSPHWLTNEPEMPQLAELVRQSKIALIGCVIWALVALGGLLLLLKRQSQWIWSVQLIGFIAFILLTLLPAMWIVDSQRQLPLRQLAAAIIQVQQPEEPILMIGYSKPSLVFYTQRHVTYVAAPSEVMNSLKTFSQQLSRPDAKVHSLLLAARPVRFKDAGIRRNQYEILDEAGAFRLARMTFPIKP